MSSKKFEPKMKHDLCQRIRSFNVPKTLTHQLISEMSKWRTNSGEEWTVSRIKSFKIDYIRKLSGKEPIGTWYAKHKDGRPKGPFGHLWKLPPKVALAILNVYSTYASSTITAKQWKKFLNAVEVPVENDRVLENLGIGNVENKEDRALTVKRSIAYIMSNLIKEHGPKTLHKVTPLAKEHLSVSKKAPTGYNSRSIPEYLWPLSLKAFQTEAYREMYEVASKATKRYDPEMGDDSNPNCIGAALVPFGCDVVQMFAQNPQYYLYDPQVGSDGYVGDVCFIQEPGYKCRYIFNPHRVLQQALRPIGDHLFSTLKNINADCTYNQHAGALFVQKQLKSGYHVWSVDLSDATSRFPRDIQLRGLEESLGQLDTQGCIALLRYILERGEWRLPIQAERYAPNKRSVMFVRGQPLGLYPSFPMFALVHHAVMQYAHMIVKLTVGRRYLGDMPFGDAYRILGDDVVIFNKYLYEAYRHVLNVLNVPISQDKTLEDASVAEFAGRVITKDDVIVLPKYRSVSDDSFVDIARQFGPKVTNIFRPRQRKVLKWLAPLPEELGGLGWNPKGLPLSTRISKAEAFVFRETSKVVTVQDPLIRVKRLMNGIFYSQNQYQHLTGFRCRASEGGGEVYDRKWATDMWFSPVPYCHTKKKKKEQDKSYSFVTPDNVVRKGHIVPDAVEWDFESPDFDDMLDPQAELTRYQQILRENEIFEEKMRALLEEKDLPDESETHSDVGRRISKEPEPPVDGYVMVSKSERPSTLSHLEKFSICEEEDKSQKVPAPS